MSIYKIFVLIPIKEKGYVMIIPTEPAEEFDELIEDETIIIDENGDEPAHDRRRIFADKLDPPIDSLFLKNKRGDLI